MSVRKTVAWGIALTLAAAALRGLGTIVVKDAVSTLSSALVVGARFSAAGLILLFIQRRRIFHARDQKLLFHGAILGGLTSAVFLLHHAGMTTLSPADSSFLLSTYCVITPFIAWVWKRQTPQWQTWLASGLCIFGIWLLFNRGPMSNFAPGAWLTLASAALFAVQIVTTASFTQKEDPIALTTAQFLVAGTIGLLVFALTGAKTGELSVMPNNVLQIVYLVVFSTLLAMTMQNEGAKRIPPWQAALFLSMEAPFAILASLVAGYAGLDAPTMVAFAAIIAAVILSAKS